MRRIEFDRLQYREIADHCEARGIDVGLAPHETVVEPGSVVTVAGLVERRPEVRILGRMFPLKAEVVVLEGGTAGWRGGVGGSGVLPSSTKVSRRRGCTRASQPQRAEIEPKAAVEPPSGPAVMVTYCLPSTL